MPGEGSEQLQLLSGSASSTFMCALAALGAGSEQDLPAVPSASSVPRVLQGNTNGPGSGPGSFWTAMKRASLLINF